VRDWRMWGETLGEEVSFEMRVEDPMRPENNQFWMESCVM